MSILTAFLLMVFLLTLFVFSASQGQELVLMHQGRVLAGGSELAMDDIGNDEESSLKCITDEVNTECCRSSDGDVDAADWFDPTMHKIPRRRDKTSTDPVYTRVANQEIRLYRQVISTFISNFGTFYCLVKNSTGHVHEINITLYPTPCRLPYCHANAGCQKVGDLLSRTFTCTCRPPFAGDGYDCQVPDPCLSASCPEGGSCTRIGAYNETFYCTCPPSFYWDGTNCTVIPTTPPPTTTHSPATTTPPPATTTPPPATTTPPPATTTPLPATTTPPPATTTLPPATTTPPPATTTPPPATTTPPPATTTPPPATTTLPPTTTTPPPATTTPPPATTTPPPTTTTPPPATTTPPPATTTPPPATTTPPPATTTPPPATTTPPPATTYPETMATTPTGTTTGDYTEVVVNGGGGTTISVPRGEGTESVNNIVALPPLISEIDRPEIVPRVPEDKPPEPNSIYVTFRIIPEQGDADRVQILVQRQPSFNMDITSYFHYRTFTNNFPQYIAMEINLKENLPARRGKREKSSSEYIEVDVVIGSIMSCGRNEIPCNGPLEPNTEYAIRYKLIAGTSVAFYDFGVVEKTAPRKENKTSIMVGVVLVMALFLFLVVLLVLVFLAFLHRDRIKTKLAIKTRSVATYTDPDIHMSPNLKSKDQSAELDDENYDEVKVEELGRTKV